MVSSRVLQNQIFFSFNVIHSALFHWLNRKRYLIRQIERKNDTDNKQQTGLDKFLLSMRTVRRIEIFKKKEKRIKVRTRKDKKGDWLFCFFFFFLFFCVVSWHFNTGR